MDFDINSLMQQAQAMQEKMKKMQDEAANAEVTGESGAGLVKVTMNGRHDVKSVDIDASLMSEDKELLEDLLAAHHHADRPSDFLGGDRGRDRFLADAELRSEPASDIARDDPHPVVFDTQRVGEFVDVVVQHL